MKIFLTALLIGMFCFASYSKSDDDKDATNDCKTCNLDFVGETIVTEFSHNGDGTMTVTSDGEEQTESLEGLSFNEFIAAYKQFGASCN